MQVDGSFVDALGRRKDAQVVVVREAQGSMINLSLSAKVETWTVPGIPKAEDRLTIEWGRAETPRDARPCTPRRVGFPASTNLC